MDYGYAGWTRDENFLKVRMNLKKVFCCWFLLSNGRMSGIFVLFLAWRHLLIERLGALTLIIKIKNQRDQRFKGFRVSRNRGFPLVDRGFQ